MAPFLDISHPSGLHEPKVITNGFEDSKVDANVKAKSSIKPGPDTSEDDLAVSSLRSLLFDICNQNGGGHGGSAIGMAAIGVALFKYTMRYNPSNPDWFDRDRFVISNGELLKRSCPAGESS